MATIPNIRELKAGDTITDKLKTEYKIMAVTSNPHPVRNVPAMEWRLKVLRIRDDVVRWVGELAYTGSIIKHKEGPKVRKRKRPVRRRRRIET